MATTRAMTAKFPGTCTACGLRFPEGAAILWAKGAGAKHATPAACAAAVSGKTASAPVGSTVAVGEFSGVIGLFETAKAHLKFPKIRLMVGDTLVILSVAGPKAKRPGSVTLVGEGTYPTRPWFGSVSPDGTWTGSGRTAPAFAAALGAVLKEFSANPAKVAKEHAKLTGHCCFCGKLIGHGAEERSAAVGFGPDCAENYGLLAEWKAGTTPGADLVAAEAAIDPAPPVSDWCPEGAALES